MENFTVNYETKRLKSSIRLALAAAVTLLPMTALAAESSEPETYDMETVEVVGKRPAPAPVQAETPAVYAGESPRRAR